MNSLIIVAAAIFFNPTTQDVSQDAVQVGSLTECAAVLNAARAGVETSDGSVWYPVESICAVGIVDEQGNVTQQGE